MAPCDLTAPVFQFCHQIEMDKTPHTAPRIGKACNIRLRPFLQALR
jgi:hypothetical protein